MIIDVIDVERIAFNKAKGHAPIRSNRHRPRAFRFALQRMQPEAREVHIGNRPSGVKARQNVTELFDMFMDEASRIIFLIKALQCLVPE